MCNILSLYYRHESPECTLETFPCSSQIGKDPSQRKTQHTANGKQLQCPLFSRTENTLVLKGIGRKMCMLRACYKVVSPSIEAVGKNRSCRAARSEAGRFHICHCDGGSLSGGPLCPSWHQALGSFCQESFRVCMITPKGYRESLGPGLPLDNSTHHTGAT